MEKAEKWVEETYAGEDVDKWVFTRVDMAEAFRAGQKETEWVSVKDKLPEIPERRHAVSVIVAQFDRTYEEIRPGKGYSVFQASFNGNDFLDLCSNGDFMPMADPVTHWMPLPEPPTTQEIKTDG